MLVAVQLSTVGLYTPPVFKFVAPNPPQTIISLPVHTAVWLPRASGALVVLVAVQLSVPGLYLPPVFVTPGRYPPQTIISLPVHTAVWPPRASGALVVLVAVQLSVLGIVPPAGVQSAAIDLCGGAQVISSPDDHFTTSPNCRVTWPVTGRVCGAGGCPRIVTACGTIRYCRKSIASTRHCYAIQNLVFRAGSRGPRPPFQFAMGSLAAHMQICYQALREQRPSQTLSDNKGIVTERFKELA